MFSHHAATRRINSEPKSRDQNGMLPRDSCNKGPQKHPLQYCWPLTISGQAMSDVLIFLLAGPLNEILVFVWYPVIMITIILEYYTVIVSDYQHLHATITTHWPGNHWSTLPGHTSATLISWWTVISWLHPLSSLYLARLHLSCAIKYIWPLLSLLSLVKFIITSNCFYHDMNAKMSQYIVPFVP